MTAPTPTSEVRWSSLQAMLFALLLNVSSIAMASGEPALQVEPAERRALEEPAILVQGAVPGGRVIVEASLTDRTDRTWTSRGVFYADYNGSVDPAQQASVGGTYIGIDSFGLFWSMLPFESAELDENLNVDPITTDWPRAPVFGLDNHVEVQLSATLETSTTSLDTAAVSTTHRVLFASDAGSVRTEVSEGDLRGVLYTPRTRGSNHPVMVVTGSGGGAAEVAARALADEGFTALALAHFNYPGRPDELVNIPLEYFRDALDFLRRKTGSEKVALMGGSRGGEAVLLIASTYPERVSAVVSGVPANIVNSACCSDAMTYLYAWTLGGEPLPTFGLIEGTDFESLLGVHEKYGDDLVWFYRHMLAGFLTDDPEAEYMIQVERIAAPILLISGDDDMLWPSSMAADAVVARLRANDYAYPYRHLKVSGAGHLASSGERMFVTSAIGRGGLSHPLSPEIVIRMGGTPRGNFHGVREAHFEKIAFLKEHAADGK
ncbi:MAG: acyl-CoA thioesterase/bile acid-CoA:amino acid N-acyltransferase family protein [Acidobacteriota bacterium]